MVAAASSPGSQVRKVAQWVSSALRPRPRKLLAQTAGEAPEQWRENLGSLAAGGTSIKSPFPHCSVFRD